MYCICCANLYWEMGVLAGIKAQRSVCNIDIQHHTTLAIFAIFRFRLLRMNTSADIPGTERLTVSAINHDHLTTPRLALQTSDICSDKPEQYLEPMSTFHVKGWSRCLCMTTCLLHAYAEPEMLKARYLTAIASVNVL